MAVVATDNLQNAILTANHQSQPIIITLSTERTAGVTQVVTLMRVEDNFNKSVKMTKIAIKEVKRNLKIIMFLIILCTERHRILTMEIKGISRRDRGRLCVEFGA